MKLFILFGRFGSVFHSFFSCAFLLLLFFVLFFLLFVYLLTQSIAVIHITKNSLVFLFMFLSINLIVLRQYHGQRVRRINRTCR